LIKLILNFEEYNNTY